MANQFDNLLRVKGNFFPMMQVAGFFLIGNQSLVKSTPGGKSEERQKHRRSETSEMDEMSKCRRNVEMSKCRQSKINVIHDIL